MQHKQTHMLFMVQAFKSMQINNIWILLIKVKIILINTHSYTHTYIYTTYEKHFFYAHIRHLYRCKPFTFGKMKK